MSSKFSKSPNDLLAGTAGGPVLLTFQGIVTLPKIEHWLRLRWEKGLWHRPIFIDARHITIGLTNQEIEKAAHTVSTIVVPPPSAPARTAIWVADPLNYGLGRVYMSFGSASDRGFSVFYERELAMGWLSASR